MVDAARGADGAAADQHAVLREADVGAHVALDGDRRRADEHRLRVDHRVGARDAHVRRERRVAQQVVDVPVVLDAGRAGLQDRDVAGEDQRVVGHVPQVLGLAVVVEDAVVGAQLGGVVHGVDDDGRAVADAPPVVLVPVGGVRAADVADGALVGGAQEGLAEALAGVVGRGQAAVADREQVLAVVLQAVDVGDGEARVAPAGLAAVGGVVRVGDTRADLGDDQGVVAARLRVQVGVALDAVGGVEVGAGAVVDLAVAVDERRSCRPRRRSSRPC